MKDDKMPKLVVYDKDKKDLMETVLDIEKGILVPTGSRINFSDITHVGSFLAIGDDFKGRRDEQRQLSGINSLFNNALRDAKEYFNPDYVQINLAYSRIHKDTLQGRIPGTIGRWSGELYAKVEQRFEAVATLYIKNQAKK